MLDWAPIYLQLFECFVFFMGFFLYGDRTTDAYSSLHRTIDTNNSFNIYLSMKLNATYVYEESMLLL